MQTVAELIERFIAEMGTEAQPGLKPLGVSHLHALRAMQRRPIAQKVAAELRKGDVIEHCKERRKTVCAATVQQDMTFLNGVLKYAGSAWDDCEDVSSAAIEAAKPLLNKYQLIGKSTPRTRVPTVEELERLQAMFEQQNRNSRTKIDMTQVVAFALVSTRRISEICRMRWSDIDWERRDDQGNATPMYMVRDLKHPKKKKGNDKWFPLFPELIEIIKRQPRLDANDPLERVFPYNHKSAGARYTEAKKKLGIKNLHFHDNRREAITRWLAKLKSAHLVRFISAHENTTILERVYDATDPATLHQALRDQPASHR